MGKSKEISPSQISESVDYDIGDARELCGDVLEDVNDHSVAHALFSLNLGDVDLACEFLRLGAAIDEAGELTKELREKQNKLLDTFSDLSDKVEEEEENEGDEE